VVQEFIAKYKAAYGAVPDALAVLGYDAAKVAFDAMERAPDLTGPAVAKAIAETKGFQGVSGVINLDADHNAVKSAVVLGIEKNKTKYAATVAP
jgi:branched-chain amino acid transport system substrate-binding protein